MAWHIFFHAFWPWTSGEWATVLAVCLTGALFAIIDSSLSDTWPNPSMWVVYTAIIIVGTIVVTPIAVAKP